MRNRSVVSTKAPALTATQGLHPRGIDPLFSHSNSVTTYVHTPVIFRPLAQADNYNNSQITSVDLLQLTVAHRDIDTFVDFNAAAKTRERLVAGKERVLSRTHFLLLKQF